MSGWARSWGRAVGAALLTAACGAAVVAPAGVAGAAGFDCASSGPAYTVGSGDGWFVIADRLSVSASSLLEANGAEAADLLVAGDRLCLPDGADLSAVCSSTYPVASGDSWFRIAGRAGVDVSALLGANGAELDDVLLAGQRVCLPEGAVSVGSGSSDPSGPSVAPGATYVIRSGDSWSTIADRAEVSMSSLLSVNGATTATVLIAGREIVLPAGAAEMPPVVVLEAKPTQGPCWFGDTWLDPRDGGRAHLGVDIFTLAGAYVYAVADGRLTGRVWAGAGENAGNAWVLTADDGTRYFFAHLADFNPDLATGSRVRAGQILGWVGGTGNASAPHLHLEIRPGGGEPINPFPIVHEQGGCNRGTPYTQPGGWVPDRIG